MDLTTVGVFVLVVLAFVGGVAYGRSERPQVDPQIVVQMPAQEPVSPTARIAVSHLVHLVGADGKLQAVSVANPRFRLWYDGKAWDQWTTINGIRTYRLADADTERQTQLKARSGVH